MRRRADPVARFWRKVDTSGDCWLWTGAKAGFGHGRFAGWDGRVVAAHRFSWELASGRPIPEGQSVLHRCDNPPCVRPGHLFLGTQQDNVDDMHAKGRGAIGVRHPAAKLSETQVIAIREAYASGEPRLIDLSRQYGVSEGIVSQIVRGIRYPAVGGPRVAKHALFVIHRQRTMREKEQAA